MNPEFKRCLEKGKIVTFEKGPSLVLKELNSANDDLLSSKDSLKRKNINGQPSKPTIQCSIQQGH